MGSQLANGRSTHESIAGQGAADGRHQERTIHGQPLPHGLTDHGGMARQACTTGFPDISPAGA
jgi:hypothetical protein